MIKFRHARDVRAVLDRAVEAARRYLAITESERVSIRALALFLLQEDGRVPHDLPGLQALLDELATEQQAQAPEDTETLPDEDNVICGEVEDIVRASLTGRPLFQGIPT